MTKKITPLSVVIPCKNDPEVVNCIQSIKYPVAEIMIVFNGATQEFVAYVRDEASRLNIDITTYELPRANLARALEYGTQHARYDLVLYMDSDCVFREGAVQAFVDVAAVNDPASNVFKGDVVFAQGRNMIERLISASRSHHTAEVLTAYKPPLMISRKILPKIGGYAFNPKLIWREDSDLDNRIRQAHINILPVRVGKIDHHPISLRTDLRSTFRYGIGLAIANSLNIKLTEVPRSTMSTFRSKGLAPALYMVFRNRVYDAGYVYARVKILFGKYVHDAA